MSDRYAKYSKLKIDYPSERVLRITFDRPETYNSVDAQTHTQLTTIWRDINDDSDINAVIDNVRWVLAIELTAAAQGIDLLRPLTSSLPLEALHASLRTRMERT